MGNKQIRLRASNETLGIYTPIVYIYALECPIAGDVRYVGSSVDPVVRLRSHLWGTMGADKLHRWTKALRNSKMKPNIKVLDIVLVDKRSFLEEHYIFLYRSWGFSLPNGWLSTCKKYYSEVA